MRRLAALLFVPLILVSCGGCSPTASLCKQQFWNGTVGLCLPAGWSVVPRETLTERGLSSDVVAAFQAEKAVSGQFPTVTVVEEKLTRDDVTSTAYSQASIRAVATLPGYKLVDSRATTVDGANVQLHIFTAQPLNEEPERRFYQVSAVSNKKGYTFTGLTPVSISSSLENEILTILKSVTFKDQGPGGTAASSK